jgi:hypothetical protein
VLDSRLETLEPVYRWPLPYDEVLHYECLYAVGGGVVEKSGGFPQFRLHRKDHPCATVFNWYFSEKVGQYWADLQSAGESAIAYLTNTTYSKGDNKNMVIFDIDETVLSNIGPMRERNFQGTDEKTQRAHTEANFAPALEAIKQVYLSAYHYGMSVRSSLQWRRCSAQHGTAQHSTESSCGERAGVSSLELRRCAAQHSTAQLTALMWRASCCPKLPSLTLPEHSQATDKGIWLTFRGCGEAGAIDTVHAAAVIVMLSMPRQGRVFLRAGQSGCMKQPGPCELIRLML